MWDPFGPHKEKFESRSIQFKEVYNKWNCILSPVSDFCEILYNPRVSDLLRAWVREWERNSII